MSLLFHNARVFQTSTRAPATHGNPHHSFAEALVADPSTGKITHVGPLNDPSIADILADPATKKVDLGGKLLLPGLIDAHLHLLVHGQSLQRVPLDHCESLEDIRTAIKEYAVANPHVPRILCRGWMRYMTGNEATADMLDGLDDRPIFIDSKDLHATWCSRSAIAEIGIEEMADPPGGHIQRDAEGHANGLLTEASVFMIVWPHLSRVASMEEKLASLTAAIESYVSDGYTGLVDMAMEENSWEALLTLRKRQPSGRLPVRVAAYWLINPADDGAEALKQVDRAIELSKQYPRTDEAHADLRILGIKIICDGIVDACTAALTKPYADGRNPDMLWSLDELRPVVKRAAEAGLQCTLHAIGDRAISTALDALEPHADPALRHRMEHLELASSRDVERLARLGITASIQPVHADPAILIAWPEILGPERCLRAFPYSEFANAGAHIALGSDAPTSSHDILGNVYTATTRRSARKPDLKTTVNPNFALSISSALAGATEGAAYSCFLDEWTGKIEVGKMADFVVLDMEWVPEQVLKGKVMQTWYAGKKVYDVELGKDESWVLV